MEIEKIEARHNKTFYSIRVSGPSNDYVLEISGENVGNVSIKLDRNDFIGLKEFLNMVNVDILKKVIYNPR